MYQLVRIKQDKEEVLFVAENLLDVKLHEQIFIRSISSGRVEIREAPAKPEGGRKKS